MDHDFSREEVESCKKRFKNLKIYSNYTDSELEEIAVRFLENSYKSKGFERRIEEKLKEFEKDYDLSDLKANDMFILRAMIQALLALEDYEQQAYLLQRDVLESTEDSEKQLVTLERLNRIMDTLRQSILKFQDDLKISRKIRSSDQENSLQEYIENLKKKAKKFYESKTARVFCPKCRMLLGTVWVLYPKSKHNKFHFYCDRCKESVAITYPELVSNNLVNIEDVPDF